VFNPESISILPDSVQVAPRYPSTTRRAFAGGVAIGVCAPSGGGRIPGRQPLQPVQDGVSALGRAANLGGGASSSLESRLGNAHTHGSERLLHDSEPGQPDGIGETDQGDYLACGGWLREVCYHNNVRWHPLPCRRWECDQCGPGKRQEFLERLQGAMERSREKGWTLKFVTLTWSADVGKERVRLDLAHLVQGIRRRYGYCEYAKVPELTRGGSCPSSLGYGHALHPTAGSILDVEVLF